MRGLEEEEGEGEKRRRGFLESKEAEGETVDREAEEGAGVGVEDEVEEGLDEWTIDLFCPGGTTDCEKGHAAEVIWPVCGFICILADRAEDMVCDDDDDDEEVKETVSSESESSKEEEVSELLRD